jgi:hypothetical protein
MIVSRPATYDDVRRYYPDVTSSFRAWVCEVDGVVSGIIGVTLTKPYWCLFSVVDDALKPFLGSVKIGRLIKRVQALVEQSKVPVMAIAQPGLDTAPIILRRLGFEEFGVIDGDSVYQRRP